MNDIQLLCEAILALAQAVRDAPPPVINVTVAAPELPEAADHPITVTVVEREHAVPIINVPVTVSPTPVTVESAPAQVEIHEAAESPDPTSWEVLREPHHPYRITGFRAR